MEHANRNLKSALKIFHHQSQGRWDEDIPLLSVAFNTAVHESSKFTPDLLFWGSEMKCPLLSRWDLSSSDEAGKPVTNQSVWTQVYINLKAARDRVARRCNVNRKPHRYKVGDMVMFKKNLIS